MPSTIPFDPNKYGLPIEHPGQPKPIDLAAITASLELCESDVVKLANRWYNPSGKVGRRGPRVKTLHHALYKSFFPRARAVASIAYHINFQLLSPSNLHLFERYAHDRLDVLIRDWIKQAPIRKADTIGNTHLGCLMVLELHGEDIGMLSFNERESIRRNVSGKLKILINAWCQQNDRVMVFA